MPVFGGGFSAYDPPQRSGIFINTVTQSAPASRTDASGVVGLIVQADWGPDNAITDVTTPEAATVLFGTGQTAQFALQSALLGENVTGRGGARKVLAYRILSGGVVATATINKAGPTASLTINAKYKGIRGNNFTITVQTNALDATKQDLILKESGTTLETYTYTTGATGAIAALAALITANSSYITGTLVSEGTLINGTTSMAGGTNGAALVAGDYTTAQAAFEARAGDFSVFALDDINPLSTAIQNSFRDWIDRINLEGALVHMVVGGALAEAVGTATLRSGPIGSNANATDSEFIVNLTRDVKIGTTVYSSSRMAPRVAGIIAAAGVARSISFAQINGGVVNNPPTASEVELCVRGSVVPFVQVDGVARLQRGRTSYTTTLTGQDPKIYRSLLSMRKIMEISRQLAKVQVNQVTGQDGIVNDPIQRGAVLNLYRAAMQKLQQDKIAQPDWTVDFDTSQDNTGETIWLKIVARPSYGVEVTLVTMSIPV